jgi:RHS repeat-associated protein
MGLSITKSPAYDANGNTTDDGSAFTFKYNYRNQIVEARHRTTGLLVGSYMYDAAGRRVEKAVAGGATQRFIYSGAETITTFDGSNNWQQNFVFGYGIDDILMLEQKDVLDFDSDLNTTEVTRAFYHLNALGSVMEITDMNQAIVEDYRYSAYGEPTITRSGVIQTADPLGQHWAFTARFYDEETSQYWLRTRPYDPGLGRFTTRDPASYDGSFDLYEYVGSDPTDSTDPFGLSELKHEEKLIRSQTVEEVWTYVCEIPEGQQKSCWQGRKECALQKVIVSWDIEIWHNTDDWDYTEYKRNDSWHTTVINAIKSAVPGTGARVVGWAAKGLGSKVAAAAAGVASDVLFVIGSLVFFWHETHPDQPLAVTKHGHREYDTVKWSNFHATKDPTWKRIPCHTAPAGAKECVFNPGDTYPHCGMPADGAGGDGRGPSGRNR